MPVSETKYQTIVITGPESAGKTKLAKSLAQKFDIPWVPEYARRYLSMLNRPYDMYDVLKIAHGQRDAIDTLAGKNTYIIADTAALVIKIWLKLKYSYSCAWVDQWFNESDCYYLLCRPDIPWISDPLRENPANRLEIYEKYYLCLLEANKSFSVISGIHWDKRFSDSQNIVRKIVGVP